MFPDPLMLVLEDTCTCLRAVPLLDAGKCRVTPLLTENRFGFQCGIITIHILTRESLIGEQGVGGLSGLAPPLPEAPDADSGGGGPGQEQAQAGGGQHCGQVQPQQRGEAGARADTGTGLVLAMTAVRSAVTNLEMIILVRRHPTCRHLPGLC